MLLRPATPLSVVLFAAFALMLLAVLSTPVIEAIPLAEFQDAKFGVFGYCKGSDGCTSIGIGYDIGSSSTSHVSFLLQRILTALSCRKYLPKQ